MNVGPSRQTTSTTYHTSLVLTIAAALLAASGCSAGRPAAAASSTAATAAPFPALKPFFVPGESITWDVTMAGVTGARARLAVGEASVVDGRPMVVLRAEAESSGIAVLVKEVRSSMSSWVDVETGVPARSESDSFGIGNSLLVHTQRATHEPLAEFTIWRKKAGQESTEGQSKRQRLPVIETHDPLSATLMVRAWNAPVGTRALMYSLGGVRLWRTILTVEAKEEMTTAIGKRRVVRIRGTSTRLRAGFEEDKSKPARVFTLWVSDDDQRVPVKIAARTEMGELVAKATSYQVSE